MPIKVILPLSAIGRATNLRRLSPLYIHIFLMVFSLCYKGKHYRRMIYISHEGIIMQLKRMYDLDISRQQVTRAMNKFISLGLVERKTAHFVKPVGGILTPQKMSYYRLSTHT